MNASSLEPSHSIYSSFGFSVDRETLECSVSDPLHFDVGPDPRIHFREKWIRPNIKKIK